MEHLVFSKKQKYVEHPMCNKKSTWNILYKQKHMEHPIFSKKSKSTWNILCSAKNPKAHGTSCVQQKKQKHVEHPMWNKKESTWNILYKQKHLKHPISSKKQKYIEHPMFSKKQSIWNILCWTKAYETSHVSPKKKNKHMEHPSPKPAWSWPEAVCNQLVHSLNIMWIGLTGPSGCSSPIRCASALQLIYLTAARVEQEVQVETESHSLHPSKK